MFKLAGCCSILFKSETKKHILRSLESGFTKLIWYFDTEDTGHPIEMNLLKTEDPIHFHEPDAKNS